MNCFFKYRKRCLNFSSFHLLEFKCSHFIFGGTFLLKKYVDCFNIPTGWWNSSKLFWFVGISEWHLLEAFRRRLCHSKYFAGLTHFFPNYFCSTFYCVLQIINYLASIICKLYNQLAFPIQFYCNLLFFCVAYLGFLIWFPYLSLFLFH